MSAGFVFTIGSNKSGKAKQKELEAFLTNYIKTGIFGTRISNPKKTKSETFRWHQTQEYTFADYVSMKTGDNVYFFCDRKIYGIGELVSLDNNFDSKFNNFPGASIPEPTSPRKKAKATICEDKDRKKGKVIRWCCVYEPSPHFFRKGVDMDDALSSRPQAFRMLRAIENLSFIRIDDEENQALKDVILKRNLTFPSRTLNKNYFKVGPSINHKSILKKIKQDDYQLKAKDIIDHCLNNYKITHEAALEAGILEQLMCDNETKELFGHCDYLARQVIASPFKPIKYMDRMDIFGYSYLPGHEQTKNKFLIIELKKDKAKVEDVEQLMKYVDWVKDEYCYGDYSMIEAFLVAYDFKGITKKLLKEKTFRAFTIGSRPTETRHWEDLKIVSYRYNPEQLKLLFGPGEFEEESKKAKN